MDLDDKLLAHPKFLRAAERGGSEAIHLWLGLRQFVAQNLTDGFIPTDMVKHVHGPIARKRAAALDVLVEVGLVEKRSDGLALHDFLQWSKSRAKILAERERNKLRQERFRESRTVSNAGVTPLVTLPSPLLSSPLHSTPGESSAHAPEVSEPPDPDEPRLTICPLDLTEKAKSLGILAEFVDRYRVEPEQIREVIREFVSYWTIGGGAGRKQANWPKKLREHLRRTCEKPGGLKPIGELEHEAHGGNGPSRGVKAAKEAGAKGMALMREAHAAEVK